MLHEKIVEKINAKEQQIEKHQSNIKKSEAKIASDREKIKMLQAEIDSLNVDAIFSIAKSASMNMTEVRSLLTDMVESMPVAESDGQGSGEQALDGQASGERVLVEQVLEEQAAEVQVQEDGGEMI